MQLLVVKNQDYEKPGSLWNIKQLAGNTNTNFRSFTFNKYFVLEVSTK